MRKKCLPMAFAVLVCLTVTRIELAPCILTDVIDAYGPAVKYVHPSNSLIRFTVRQFIHMLLWPNAMQMRGGWATRLSLAVETCNRDCDELRAAKRERLPSG